MKGKFVIIDGSSLVHRAFYALPLLTTAQGQYTNAVYGFTTMLVKLIGDLKPDLLVAAFDKSRQTFRTKIYDQYKAHRKPTQPELSQQFPMVREVLEAMGVAALEADGYEADDIIGTLAAKGSQAGYEVLIVTGDRDALQLISPQVKVLLTKKGISDMEEYDRTAFINKFGVTPEQQIDLKGLMGDASDNIPGVPGIGEKTATKLIMEYGSIENLLMNREKVSGKKLQENLTTYQEMAVLSKQLATIVQDMDIGFAAETFGFTPDSNKLREVFGKFEFKNLTGKIMDICGGEEKMPSAEAADLPPAVVLETSAAAAGVIAAGLQAGEITVWPAVNGKGKTQQLLGITLCTGALYGYIPADSEAWTDVLTLLANEAVRKVTYDAKVLYNCCQSCKCCLKGLSFDTLLAAYLLDPTASQYPLAELQQQYLGSVGAAGAEAGQEAAFGAWAVAVIQQLQPVQAELLRQHELEGLFRNIELPLVEVLSAMESRGIVLDRSALHTMATELGEKLEVLLQDIYSGAGETFNVNSPKQLGTVLFEKLQLPAGKKTKTGYSTDVEVLENLRGQHPVIERLLEYRLLSKLKSTYLDGMEGLIRLDSGRIHTSFNQMVTATGRLSSSEPNLQNIPIRTEAGRKIRQLFVPGEGYDYIMSADYSQIELRILAALSGDAGMLEAFSKGQDIHSRTAAEVFDVPMEEVTAEMRSRAKAVNFGIVYGISDYGLARDIGVSRKEASQYISNYFEKYAGVKQFMEGMVTEAHRQGFVTTLLGRKRYLPDINSSNFNRRSFAERTAMNTPIQGTAADIIKKAMIDVETALQSAKLRSRMLLQVHDELVLEVTADEREQVAVLVRQAMENSIDLAVKLAVDVKWGSSWAQAK